MQNQHQQQPGESHGNDKPKDINQAITQPQVLSSMPMSDWRGSVTTFNGFTGTRPARELEDASWDEVRNLLCPNKPAVLADKKQAQYVVPCLLKEAPFVGKTREAAISNWESATGKMRSKNHVTEANLIIMDIDGLPESEFLAGLKKLADDGLTYLIYTTHSHGSEDKPGIRARVVILLDRPLNVQEYSTAWQGIDRRYWNMQAGIADSSGANLYQQQGTWCCHPDRIEQAQSWTNDGGVASAEALLELGRAVQVPPAVEKRPRIRDLANENTYACDNSEYPPADAYKIADACQQIGNFRDTKGANQSEPLWRDSLGVTAHCKDGDSISHDWSSGYMAYDKTETATKIAYRLKTPPTTCQQFQKSNPTGCLGCAQQCRSPITLGWERQTQEAFKVSEGPEGDIPVAAEIQSLPVATAPVAAKAATKLTDQQVIAKLAALSPMEYDRGRKENAKEMGIQVSTLDSLVKARREEDNETTDGQLPFAEIKPYPDAVDPGDVLDEVVNIIQRHVVMAREQAIAAALWIAMTWFIGVIQIAPLALITAPEKACGKSQLLTIFSYLVARALSAANSSSSFLFRAIEAWCPTLLIDEADTFIRQNDELKGLINAGHTRTSAYVGRTASVGDGHEPRLLNVWGAKAFAGIGMEKHLPDATLSRAIVITLRRKMQHETVSRLRHADRVEFGVLASKLARFAEDYSQQVKHARPLLPDELSDREQDNWEPLLAIAECAGDEWLKRATDAALKLSNSGESSASPGNELLTDIRQIFGDKALLKISTANLIVELNSDDEKSWATHNNGKPLSIRQLSKLLGAYGIKSKTVRHGPSTPKGYDLEQFADAFARYLTPTPDMPQPRNDSPEAMPPNESGVADLSASETDAPPPAITF